MQQIQLVLVWLLGCGPPPDDPSAYTELGIPDARHQLGWGVDDVPWDSMSGRQRARALREHLVALKARARDREAREAARALLEQVRAIERDGAEGHLEALDSLREEVVRLDEEIR